MEILEAALKVFVEENYQGATTARIAEAAGITEPVIYMHFRSKKELFLEVIRKSREDLLSWTQKVLEENEDPIRRYQIFTDMFKYYTTEFNRDAALIWAVAATVNDPEVRAEIRRADEVFIKQLTDDIKKAIEDRKISSRHSPDVMARIIHGINSHLSWLMLVGDVRGQDWIYEGIKHFIGDVLKVE
jgi:AcrR family transcriptional regulator